MSVKGRPERVRVEGYLFLFGAGPLQAVLAPKSLVEAPSMPQSELTPCSPLGLLFSLKLQFQLARASPKGWSPVCKAQHRVGEGDSLLSACRAQLVKLEGAGDGKTDGHQETRLGELGPWAGFKSGLSHWVW